MVPNLRIKTGTALVFHFTTAHDTQEGIVYTTGRLTHVTQLVGQPFASFHKGQKVVRTLGSTITVHTEIFFSYLPVSGYLHYVFLFLLSFIDYISLHTYDGCHALALSTTDRKAAERALGPLPVYNHTAGGYRV
jgi:hypothetical protein